MRVITSVLLKNSLCCLSAVINVMAAYSSDFTVRRYSEFPTAVNRAEGFCRVCHESLNLLHGAWDAGQQLYTIRCHCNVIFNANLHSSDSSQSNTEQSKPETFKGKPQSLKNAHSQSFKDHLVKCECTTILTIFV